MSDLVCTLTERGQVSFPSALRKQMGLKPGRKLRWEPVSATEVRISVEPETVADPESALGFGPRMRGDQPRRTADWMRELRSGE